MAKAKTAATKKNSPSNSNGKGNGNPPVNWLVHWVVDEKTKSAKTQKYPQGCSPRLFKRLIKDYLNSWLALWNVYQKRAKRRALLANELILMNTARTFTIEAYLHPPAKVKKHFPVGNSRRRKHMKRGGGHLIPPEPPPPPPGEGL